MAFQIMIRIQDPKKVKDKRVLAQQLANIVESFTGKRTIINVRETNTLTQGNR
jgi:hypothetical protein